MTRAEAVRAVEERGGSGALTVSTRCNALIVGEKPGARQLAQAERWHIELIPWQEFFRAAGISWRRRLLTDALRAQDAYAPKSFSPVGG